ncbi:MAG: sugar transferase [Candidatus Moranbacteria bacterium]|nr:sugar transferase [Candidatus Moranbacteria bacterium]MBP6034495.1 sugar transferase [Candidatus Moranbacteria bacterium]MBP7695977.1 sugar transferase [Candidatus Moranbacteria bacterium]
MKRSEIFFSALQLPVDLLMISLAALSAYYVRNIPQILALRPKLYDITLSGFMEVIFFVAPIFVLIFALEGLYQMRTTRRFWQEAYRVFKATSLVLVIVIVVIFLKREWFSSRFIILAGWGFTVLYITLGRYLIARVQRYHLLKKGTGVHRVLLIGTNGKMQAMNQYLTAHRELGYKIVAQVSGVSLHEIKAIRAERGIDEVIVCDPTLTDDEHEKLLDYCQINNIGYRFIPTTLQASRISMQVGILNGEPIIEYQHTPLDGWGKVMKRAFDLFAGSILTLIALPIMGIIALLIRIEDGTGPIIYKNERVGQDGKKFYVYKFRYMLWKHCIAKENPHLEAALAFEKQLIAERNTREGGVLYKIKDDPRKMKVGAFIERYSLDELPQFFNVLRGEMSLVGPRPHQQREVDKYSEYHRRLLTIKPGITGMAQVSGRSDLPFEDEYRLDVYYIENWSLWLDIILCLKTFTALIRRRKN